jgi:hypothetical protein
MRLGAHGIRGLATGLRALGLALVLAAALTGGAGAVQGQQRYEDGAPSGIPPGFEPVDVSDDMHQIEARKQREMYNDVDRDLDWKYATPERRIRARYGGATWNMYDPFH